MTQKSLIYRGSDGTYWFVGIYSNNYEDKEEDILTWEAHLEFADWVKSNKISIPITVLHQPQYPEVFHVAQLLALQTGRISAKEYNETYKKMYAPYAFAETKTIIPINGFVFVIGKILKNKIKKVELLYKSEVCWGMSHGFIPIKEEEGIINQYRSFELSILPMEWSANELTLASIKVENTNE